MGRYQEKHCDDLQYIAKAKVWAFDQARSRNLVAAMYSSVADGMPMWVSDGEFEDADSEAIRKALRSPACCSPIGP